MMKAIYFDMDGTIADLYGVPNWLEMLHNEDTTPYADAANLVNMDELQEIISGFIKLGIIIGVISWSAMGGSRVYNKAVRAAKKQWISDRLQGITEFHVVKYGTPKHRVANVKDSILVDDNEDVRTAWKNGNTVNAENSFEMINTLRNLLEKMMED